MDTPAPAATASKPALTVVDREWCRKTQSSGYIRRVKVLSSLLRSYAPARLTPSLRDSRDDADRPQIYHDEDRVKAIHYFLAQLTDEGRRGGRRDRAA